MLFKFQGVVPTGRDWTKLDNLQRVLKHYWPSATAVRQMKEGRAPVTRKALLLLYILCDGVMDDAYREVEESYITPEERLESHAVCIDALLATCGMAALDARDPFDWLILYCLCCHADEHGRAHGEGDVPRVPPGAGARRPIGRDRTDFSLFC